MSHRTSGKQLYLSMDRSKLDQQVKQAAGRRACPSYLIHRGVRKVKGTLTATGPALCMRAQAIAPR